MNKQFELDKVEFYRGKDQSIDELIAIMMDRYGDPETAIEMMNLVASVYHEAVEKIKSQKGGA